MPLIQRKASAPGRLLQNSSSTSEQNPNWRQAQHTTPLLTVPQVQELICTQALPKIQANKHSDSYNDMRKQTSPFDLWQKQGTGEH